jgi:hypothetical protein
MKSVYVAPTARRDEQRNWLFTQDVLDAYKSDNGDWAVAAPGDRFAFFNGPYGGGRKFEVVRVQILDDGLTVVAKEL